MHHGTQKGDLRIFDSRKIRLRLDRDNRLQLEIGIEERHGPVTIVRSLPLTQADRFLSLQDEEGEEIGLIRDLNELDPESQKAVTAELELGYLQPQVTAIEKVDARHGVITWHLVTDMGPRVIHVRDRSHIRTLPGGRTILTDIHEGKYEIPPLDQLDAKSRGWLEIET